MRQQLPRATAGAKLVEYLFFSGGALKKAAEKAVRLRLMTEHNDEMKLSA